MNLQLTIQIATLVSVVLGFFGLINTMRSFLQRPNRFLDLGPSQQKMLASASYNNLIDWHITVDYEDVTFLYNRYQPPAFHVVRQPLSKTNISILQSSRFRTLTLKHPAPDVPPLDKAVVETISLWKRQIGSDISHLSISSLSALFNAILFVRAVEDHRRTTLGQLPAELLPSITSQMVGAKPPTIQNVIVTALEHLDVGRIPDNLVDLDALKTFDDIDASFVPELFGDFYQNRFARYYDYDFSQISKHALSKIYEHYVSMLRVQDTAQISFLPSLAEETVEWKLGNVYTPLFIARFFARYVRDRLPLRAFQKLRVMDPSCGSGIFLRCFLELQNEALFDQRTTESIRATFDNARGIDVDANACHATQLSLSLLSLSLAGEFPASLHILNEEALRYYLENPEVRQVADVVVANPPYVKFEAQSPEIQRRVLAVLGESGAGRPDLYLAMLKIGLEFLKPGGYGLFVLPETFLKSYSAKEIRKEIGRVAFVECVVDLTAVRVFENVGVYTILLVFQKKSHTSDQAPSAKVVRCQDRVGQALQDVLDDRIGAFPFYSIHEASQEAFQEDEWTLEPPQTRLMLRKYAQLAELGTECRLRQGMNTGADEVFIVPRRAIPDDGETLFVPLLTDREMESYSVPRSTSHRVFYPFADDKIVEETQLRNRYSKTWAYLNAHRGRLEKRSAVVAGTIPWWRPERPREPRHMLHPKIVSPHVVISPRFGLDARGRYAISRGPLIFSTMEEAAEQDHLYYLLGVLNSSACFWHIAQRSHVYDRGYSRLENSTLGRVRLPAFSSVDSSVARKIIRLVETRMEAEGARALAIESTIDDIVADLYGLNPEERRIVGMLERQNGLSA